MYMLSMIYVPGDRVASKSVPKVQKKMGKKCTKSTEENRQKSVPKVQREMEMCTNVFKVKQFTVFRINFIITF